jgi:HupE / UreJ protein
MNAPSVRAAFSRRNILWLLCWLLPLGAWAHTPSETYLNFSLSGTNLTGRWDIALLDLQHGLGLTPETAKLVSADELSRRQEALALDIVTRLTVKADSNIVAFQVTDFTTLPLNNGEYARLLLSAEPLPAPPAIIGINTRVLFNIDTNMHGLLRLEHDARTETVAFNHARVEHTFTLGVPASRWAQWWTFIREGVWHIWIGYDHILFLLALLLPSVMRRDGPDWRGVERFRPASLNVLKIVTSFTVAHSITLILAALDVVRLPSRLVESVIAASVVLVALNNLRPMFGDKSWAVTFVLGLVHGFGFAGVLGDLDPQRGELVLALLGFNVGVELGQLAIVAVFLPVAFALRGTGFYRVVIFRFGSVAAMLIAAGWMLDRVFDLNLMPF